jgi:GTP-binding protein
LGELTRYNPDLLDKQRILAVSKSDMLDEELEMEITKELPVGVPFIFISSITHKGIIALKDLLWKELNRQEFQDMESIVHRPMNIQPNDPEDNFDYTFEDDVSDDEDLNYDEIREGKEDL